MIKVRIDVFEDDELVLSQASFVKDECEIDDDLESKIYKIFRRALQNVSDLIEIEQGCDDYLTEYDDVIENDGQPIKHPVTGKAMFYTGDF